MPVTSKITHQLHLLEHTCRGNLKVQDVIDAFDAAIRLPGFERSMSVLWDCRDVRIDARPDELQALVTHAMDDQERSLVIEGIGGLLVPVTEAGYLLADLCRDMHLPCLVVAQSTLGTINHTLLTLEALRSRSLEIAGVVLSGPRNRENRAAIEKFGKADIISELDEVSPLNRTGVLRAAEGFDRAGKLREYLA